MRPIDSEAVHAICLRTPSLDVSVWLPQFEKELTERLRERAPDFVIQRIVGVTTQRNRWRASWTDSTGSSCSMATQGVSDSDKDSLLRCVAARIYEDFG